MRVTSHLGQAAEILAASEETVCLKSLQSQLLHTPACSWCQETEVKNSAW